MIVPSVALGNDACAAIIQQTHIASSDSIDSKFSLLESIHTQSEFDAAKSAGLLGVFGAGVVNLSLDDFQKYQRSEELDLQRSYSDQESHSYIAQYLPAHLADVWLQCVNGPGGGVGLMVTNLTNG